MHRFSIGIRLFFRNYLVYEKLCFQASNPVEVPVYIAYNLKSSPFTVINLVGTKNQCTDNIILYKLI